MKGKKTGGRKKGSLNKSTKFSKELINELLSDYTETNTFTTDLQSLTPKDRLDIMVKLMAFVTPKPQSIDMSISEKKETTIEERLKELAEENE